MVQWSHRQSFISSATSKNFYVADGILYIDTPIRFSICHGKTNYLVTLEEQQVSLKSNANEYSVYLKLDPRTAETKIVETEKHITGYGYDFPVNPEVGQIYFNKTYNKSYIRAVQEWKEIIQINLFRVKDGVIEDVYSATSQVGLDNVSHKVGKIQFDENLQPVRVETQQGFRFITDVDKKLLNLQEIKTSSLENVKTETIAKQEILKHDLLARTSEYGIVRATNASTDIPVIGIALNDTSVDEACFIKEKGFIRDRSWRWDVKPNTPLFCDSNGRLALTPDWTANSIQQVAYVIDVDTIYFEPKEKILINSLKAETA